jgi:hypothetical protein
MGLIFGDNWRECSEVHKKATGGKTWGVQSLKVQAKLLAGVD